MRDPITSVAKAVDGALALNFLLLHGHCTFCGAPGIWDPDTAVLRRLLDGQPCRHDDGGERFVCPCGTTMIRSRHGVAFESDRDGPRPHRCAAEHEALDRELAFERGAWEGRK